MTKEKEKEKTKKKREEVQDTGFKTVLVMRRKQMICLFPKICETSDSD